VVALAGGLECFDNAIAVGGRRIDRHQIVVVEVYAPRADLAEHRHSIDRRERVAHDVAERIAAAVADGPEAERELVFRSRCIGVRHMGTTESGAALQGCEDARAEALRHNGFGILGNRSQSRIHPPVVRVIARS
jgi:hypothetical protein